MYPQCLRRLRLYIFSVLMVGFVLFSLAEHVQAWVDYPGEPPGGDPEYESPEDKAIQDRNNACGGTCDIVISTGGLQYPIGTGLTLNGIDYIVSGGAGGFAGLTEDTNGSNDLGGVGGQYAPIPPPPGVGGGGGTGTITGVSLYSTDPNNLATCANLEQLQTGLQYLHGTNFYLNSIYGSLTQIEEGSNVGVRFNNVHAGYRWYLTADHPSGLYSPYLWCYKTTTPAAPYTIGDSVYLTPNMQADFLVGFGPTKPWLQVKGGGDTRAGTIQSPMPIMVTPSLLFDATGQPAVPGVVSVSGSIDLSDSWASAGKQNISSTNWNTNDGGEETNWYSAFTGRTRHATLIPFSQGQTLSMTDGAAYTAYTAAGDIVINQDWLIPDGEKYVLVVDGSLDVRGTITLANPNTSFIAFIVRGDIAFHSSVGVRCDTTLCDPDPTPVVEGVYVAGGSIKTGTSVPLAERFVGRGTFVANQILTQRSLGAGLNKTTSADLFLYNPAFMFTMPGVLRDFAYQWQEVAP